MRITDASSSSSNLPAAHGMGRVSNRIGGFRFSASPGGSLPCVYLRWDRRSLMAAWHVINGVSWTIVRLETQRWLLISWETSFYHQIIKNEINYIYMVSFCIYIYMVSFCI